MDGITSLRRRHPAPQGGTDGWKPGFRQLPTNRVATVTDQGKGQYGLTWDALGNLASVGAFDGQRAKGFVYSPEDRLLEARDAASGVVTRFAYDGNGERVLSWRRNGDGSLMDARLYLRDEDGRVLSEYLLHDGEEAVLDHEYLYAGARLAGQLDWSGGAALVRYVAVDYLGSTRVVLAPDGTVLDTLEYHPYGGLRQGGDVPPTTHLYTGHERDLGETSTQLDYIHARYYSYNLGRFTSVDPVGGEGGLTQSWNRYAYVRGNPVNANDPDGKKIRIGTTGNARAIREYLVNLMTRPSGRAHLQELAKAKDFEVVFRDKHITSRAKLAQIKHSHLVMHLAFGKTRPIFDSSKQRLYSGAEISIDTTAVEALHYDRSGVAITDHEIYHAQDMLQQKPLEEIRKGDLPTSDTGPAEVQGRATASEKPDISKAEAREMLNELLANSAD